MENFKRNSHKKNHKENEFLPEETVDIVNLNDKYSYEGKVLAVKNDLIVVQNMHTNKEEKYKINENRVLKLWGPTRELQEFNRVDFELNDNGYFVEAVVIKINKSNKEIILKYKNNNRYKRTMETKIRFDDNKIAPVGLYTRFDNGLELSNELKLEKSNINGRK